MSHLSLKQKEWQWLEEIEKIASSNMSGEIKLEAVKLLSARIDLYLREAGDTIIIDELTGFINRSFLGQFIDKRFSESESFGDDLSVVVLQIKLFSVFWDSFGDLEAALVLKKISEIIESFVRDNDLVCRFDTEKFILILSETDFNQASRIAEAIKHGVKMINFERNDHLDIEYGVASKSQGADSADKLFERALSQVIQK